MLCLSPALCVRLTLDFFILFAKMPVRNISFIICDNTGLIIEETCLRGAVSIVHSCSDINHETRHACLHACGVTRLNIMEHEGPVQLLALGVSFIICKSCCFLINAKNALIAFAIFSPMGLLPFIVISSRECIFCSLPVKEFTFCQTFLRSSYIGKIYVRKNLFA